MGKESIVEIRGHKYRYTYDSDTQETVYRGPVGDAPALSEEQFKEATMMEAPRNFEELESTIRGLHERRASLEDWYDFSKSIAFGPEFDEVMRGFDGRGRSTGSRAIPKLEGPEYADWDRVFVQEPPGQQKMVVFEIGDIQNPDSEMSFMIDEVDFVINDINVFTNWVAEAAGYTK